MQARLCLILNYFFYFSFQEVKAQPQNLILDSVFEDPWTAAIRFDLNIYIIII